MDYGGFLPLLFVLTGTANVILMKWIDIEESVCADGKSRHFQHPIVQTWFMFAGELFCFIIYKIFACVLQRRQASSINYNIITRGNSDFSTFSLLLPSLLDTIASVLLFMGLYLTYVSSFQLIRTGVIIFVGIFSSIYMNQRLIARHWMALFTVACGVIVIISIDVQRVLTDTVSLPHNESNAILTGDLLILLAQIFQGAQYVYEEKYLKVNDIPPMQAVGWQGVFGLVLTTLLGVCLNYMPSVAPFNENTMSVVDYFHDALTQMASNKNILGSLIAFIFTTSIHNFIGLYMAKASSTTNVLLCETIRTIFIWVFAILFEWEYINLISISGFIILQMGIISYRNAIFIEWYRSLVARMQRRRYVDLSPDPADSNINGSSRPADVI